MTSSPSIIESVEAPLFSICIPQFNRTSFLLQSLKALRDQTFADFEICISDGGSTDGRGEEIEDFLRSSGLRHKYELQQSQAPYDRNLRAAIGLASGRYCFLLGNDDMLATNTTLREIAEIVRAQDFPEVVVTNYKELSSGQEFRRVSQTGLIGSGMTAAVSKFRDYSFVSGVLLDRQRAQDHATPDWDGSEMYQMFLATRILAAGGRLLGIADIVVLKDIQIEGEKVDSYARKAAEEEGSLKERRLPLGRLGRVVMAALSPYLDPGAINRTTRQVFRQLLLFTYPPWLIEYRRIRSWRYAAGIALGMRPRNIVEDLKVSWPTRVYICALYMTVTLVGLVFPIRVFERLKPRLHKFAKRK